MGNKVTDELVSTVRSIVGSDYSDMDLIRALHVANNDPTAAINVLFDTPGFRYKPILEPQKNPELSRRNSIPKAQPILANSKENGGGGDGNRSSRTESNAGDFCRSKSGNGLAEGVESSVGEKWWLVGRGEVAGLSTCKGRRVKPGDEVAFTFPSKVASSSPSPGKVFGRGRQAAACSEIVRFSTRDSGEIGRIPNEWARCLLPLVRDKKIRVEGFFKYAPEVLSIMDTIHLSVSVYINSSMFHKQHDTSLKAASSSTEESVVHPLPTLFHLLGLTPFKKAELTPRDLCSRKRPLDLKGSSGLQGSTLHVNKLKTTSKSENEVANEEPISDADLENIVGVGDNSELEEMEPPGTLHCELRPYQKQALYWMTQREKGQCMDSAATTPHPCWEAYNLADNRGLIVYLNAFSGDTTTEFPSTLQMAKGGILADAMGLGKTIMTIALLLLAPSERNDSSVGQLTSQSSGEGSEVSGSVSDNSLNLQKKTVKFSGFDKFMKQETRLMDGGSLIVCPITLLGQWKEVDPTVENEEGSGTEGMDSLVSELANAIPGIDEAMSFAEMLKLVQTMDYSVIVFDTAPTGHTLRLLQFPSTLEKGLAKIMSLKSKFGGMISQMTRLFGVDDEFGEEAILGKLEGMKDVIEQVNRQFKDPDLTTFVCVCIPEFLSLYETERLVQELTKFEIDTHNIIINQVLYDEEDVESKLLKARMRMQQKYLDQFYMLYDDFHITKLPLLPQEVTGVEALESFSSNFVTPYQPSKSIGTVEDLERRISTLRLQLKEAEAELERFRKGKQNV